MARKKRGRPRKSRHPRKPKRRDSFEFKGRWFDAIEMMNTSTQFEIYQAVIRYALYGIEPDRLSLSARAAFLMMKPDIDPDLKAWQGVVYRRTGRGNPNFVKGQPNPYQAILDRKRAEQKRLEEE